MKKALIAYFSQGGTTRAVSEQILKGLNDEKIEVDLYDIAEGLIFGLGICNVVIFSHRITLMTMNWKWQLTLGEKLQPIFLITIILTLTWILDLESSIPLKT